MVTTKKGVKKETSENISSKKERAVGLAKSIAVKFLDKNKDGFIKDDLFTMAVSFLKKKFAKK